MVNSIKPSLDDARARIARAGEHIDALEREIASVLPAKRTISFMSAGGFFSGGKQTIKAPPLVAILIGETIYNLRAALDFLVYQLAILDTGEVKYGTKFLIEDTEEGWNQAYPSDTMTAKRRKKCWLHSLTSAHQASLKRLQPFKGCQWTERIRLHSNIDKHSRLLTIIGHSDHGPGFHAGSGPVMVQFDITTEVAFENGSLVVETLKLFQQEVSDVIEAFDPDFQ